MRQQQGILHLPDDDRNMLQRVTKRQYTRSVWLCLVGLLTPRRQVLNSNHLLYQPLTHETGPHSRPSLRFILILYFNIITPSMPVCCRKGIPSGLSGEASIMRGRKV